ncbi:MAG TPA: ABC transporter permease [Bryobacteraceae bacterium]|nr:ABC transporter permease [Bryobacteraceae bacterium]
MELLRNCGYDLRYGARTLLRARGLTVVAAITLTIGIGANTAIFSIIDTVLLRPLPFRDANQLVALNETEAAPGHYPFTGPDFIDWKTQNKTFQDMTLFGWSGDMNLGGKGTPEHVSGLPAEANFFSLLGVAPLVGRTFEPGEDQPGKDQVTVLSYGLWQGHFAGDRGVIGRTIELDGKTFTVVGVMPATFRFPSQAQLWIPLDMDSKTLGQRGSHWANAIGRLKPGVTLQTARADLKVIAARLEKTYPDSNDKVGAAATSLHDELVGDSRDSLLMMLSAVGLVLLIACANVANLLLSRAVARQKEMAVRSALGAGRGRLLRQLLTESLLLSLSGGALGLLVARGILTAFAHTQSFALGQFTIQLNAEVLAFTLALAVGTGVLFGIIPALRTAAPDLHEELKGGAGSSVSPGKRRRFTSNALVVGEMALSMLLLVCAGLLLKDFVKLRNLDIGVRPDGVFTAGVQLPEMQYKTSRQRFDFARSLLEKAAHIPAVDVAAVSNRLPLEGGSNYYAKLRGSTDHMSNQLVETHAVSPDYFRAMGVRLLEGRVFAAADMQNTLKLDDRWPEMTANGASPKPEQTDTMVYPTVINQAMARFFWPGRSPLGQMFSQGSDHGPWREVIGVVGDVRQWGVTDKPIPEAYEAFDGDSRLFLVLHGSVPPDGLRAPVREALRQLDASLPLFSVRTMDDVIAEHVQGQQFLSMLVGSFALLAVLLAAVGIYGVLSYAFTQRTREIGIRMSLGATRSRVLRDVLIDGMRLAVLGFVAGIAGAMAAARVMSSLLHEVQPGDPWIFVATAGLLAMVALVACYLPARRAAGLDPMRALRHE